MAGSLAYQAFKADTGGRFLEACDLYWRAFEAGEPFDLDTTLRALFVFFDSTDPGVGPANGLSPEQMEVAHMRFHAMLDHLVALGHSNDAEVWRWWIGQLGMDEEHSLPAGVLEDFAREGSREAAWRLAANGDRTTEVVNLAGSLKNELAGETSFRSAYILHMLRDFQVA